MLPFRQPSGQPSPDIVLYHADCADGFGAAWALWKKFPNAKYIPVKHGFDPPGGLEGCHVVIVDFSYPREVIERIAGLAANLLVLDHHVTAQATLQGLPYAYFDMRKSGSVLAWEWAHQESVPWLLQYIQDKDLWEWHLPLSREINAALASYPFEFETWDTFCQDALKIEGQAILRFEKALVEKFVNEAVLVSFAGETIPAVYSPTMTSQIGERLCEGFPFCIIWHERNGRRYFSLRSKVGTVDVSAIAARNGGGGHVNAAGFSISLSSQAAEILNPLKGLTLR